jgi:hypothetical protein
MVITIVFDGEMYIQTYIQTHDFVFPRQNPRIHSYIQPHILSNFRTKKDPRKEAESRAYFGSFAVGLRDDRGGPSGGKMAALCAFGV